MISSGKTAEEAVRCRIREATTNGQADALACRSPSLLAGDARRGATELKFRCSPHQARTIEEFFRPLMALDPYAVSCEEGRYRVSTLYLDTPAFDVFHRQGPHRFHKYRIRRYGDAADLYLEQKSKRGGRVSKRRIKSTLAEFPRLMRVDGYPEENWFCDDLREGGFLPVCELSYRRRPFFAILENQPVRMTFDFELRARLHRGWEWESTDRPWTPLFPEQVVCEMKFTGALPVLMKTAIQNFGLIPGGCSKYRHSVELLGLESLTGPQSEIREPYHA